MTSSILFYYEKLPTWILDAHCTVTHKFEIFWGHLCHCPHMLAPINDIAINPSCLCVESQQIRRRVLVRQRETGDESYLKRAWGARWPGFNLFELEHRLCQSVEIFIGMLLFFFHSLTLWKCHVNARTHTNTTALANGTRHEKFDTHQLMEYDSEHVWLRAFIKLVLNFDKRLSDQVWYFITIWEHFFVTPTADR